MSRFRFHPVETRRRFGFAQVMANPDYTAFRAWHDTTRRLPQFREVEATLSAPAGRDA
jgi:hypothetical protein